MTDKTILSELRVWGLSFQGISGRHNTETPTDAGNTMDSEAARTLNRGDGAGFQVRFLCWWVQYCDIAR